MVIDHNGQMWFATQTGIVRYDELTKNTRIYEAKEKGETGLSHDNVSDIAIDSSGKSGRLPERDLIITMPI